MNEDMQSLKGRQFICSCSKSYLSYAALFTHIKQKHEGKAPGPIVRPRSERKRGRPRKNPQAESDGEGQDSDRVQNGISKTLDNNNIVQKKEEHQKTKKAAQLLGCGGFVAFTAYKPEPLRPSPKKLSESAKKNVSKKSSNQKFERKCSHSLLPLHEKQPHIESNPQIQHEQPKEAMEAFCHNLQILNKCELKKIFASSSCRECDLPIDPSELEIFQQLGISYDGPDQPYSQDETIVQGINQFLKEIKNILNEDQEPSSSTNSEFKQVLLLISFLFQYLTSELNEDIRRKELTAITAHMGQFALEYLPAQIARNRLEEIELFREMNPIKFVLFLSNWMVLKRAQAQFSQAGLSSKLGSMKMEEQFKIQNQNELKDNVILNKTHSESKEEQNRQKKQDKKDEGDGFIEFGVIQQDEYRIN